MKENLFKRFFASHKSYTVIAIVIVLIFAIVYIISTSFFYLYKASVYKQDVSVINLENLSTIIVQAMVWIIMAILADVVWYGSAKNALSKIDFKNNELIYRDIIHQYSAIELAYIDNFKEDFFKYITITLLTLELKGYIKITEEDGIKIVNNDQYNLKKSERYILNIIDEGFVRITSAQEFTKLAKQEAMEDELISKKPFTDKRKNSLVSEKVLNFILKSCFSIFAIPFIMSIILVLCFNQNVEDFKYMYQVIMYIIGFMIPIAYGINIIINDVSKYTKSFRTELGEEINFKLEGLKNYIQNYSLLDKRSMEQLKMWDEYLIYSVMFNKKHKIIKDISKYVFFK